MRTSRIQLRILEAFKLYPYNTDLSIAELYRFAFGRDDAEMPHRHRQQRLGSSISRLNTKLDGHRIIPGTAKRTYRMVQLATDAIANRG